MNNFSFICKNLMKLWVSQPYMQNQSLLFCICLMEHQFKILISVLSHTVNFFLDLPGKPCILKNWIWTNGSQLGAKNSNTTIYLFWSIKNQVVKDWSHFFPWQSKNKSTVPHYSHSVQVHTIKKCICLTIVPQCENSRVTIWI